MGPCWGGDNHGPFPATLELPQAGHLSPPPTLLGKETLPRVWRVEGSAGEHTAGPPPGPTAFSGRGHMYSSPLRLLFSFPPDPV